MVLLSGQASDVLIAQLFDLVDHSAAIQVDLDGLGAVVSNQKIYHRKKPGGFGSEWRHRASSSAATMMCIDLGEIGGIRSHDTPCERATRFFVATIGGNKQRNVGDLLMVGAWWKELGRPLWFVPDRW